MIDVALNGENHTFPPTGEFTNYVFQGGGGSDTATLTGSPAGGNSALLYINGTGQLNNTSQDFAVSVSGMTSIVANGYAGDIAQFYTKKGVTGDNTYYAYADNAAYNSGAAAEPSAGMYGTGYSNVANGFSTNIGYSNHAGDVAYFYGSTGSDTFYANADYNSSGVHTAGMLGSYTGRGSVNYANAATGFATNVGNTLPNTSDTAYFYGAAGNDTYYAYAYAQNGNSVAPSAGMFGSFGGGYSNAATGFAINVGNYAPARAGTPIGPAPPSKFRPPPARPISTTRRATTSTMPTGISPTTSAATPAVLRRGCTAVTPVSARMPTWPTASPATSASRPMAAATRPIFTMRRARARSMPTPTSRTARFPGRRPECTAAAMPTRPAASARTWPLRRPATAATTRPTSTTRRATTRTMPTRIS